ncbi:MAG TPA: DUF2934 domain-containing protein [Candidatus Polarisedimenticolia bacterium]|nr:DUF2934 domain-containing protein [Candidatus Polarisedimenticolia bacterium]
MTDPNSTPTHEQIARRAYEIFTERGQPEGQDLAHWLEAERQLRAASQTKSNGAQMTSTSSTNTAVRPTTPAVPTAASQSQSRSNGRPRAAARK